MIRYIVLFCLVAFPLAAEEAKRVMYDGTQMGVVLEDGGIEIKYIEPPAMLREIGVVPGQVLVRGKWDGAVLSGEAFMFSPHCPPEAYPIRGLIDRDGDLLVLGPVPMSCGGPKEWTSASVMRFEAIMEKPKTRRKTEPKRQEPKAKPKSKPRPVPRPQPQPRYDWREYQWRW